MQYFLKKRTIPVLEIPQELSNKKSAREIMTFPFH